jgi:hypothetical protein
VRPAAGDRIGCGGEGAGAVAQKHRDRAGEEIGRRQIGLTIVVEITAHHAHRGRSGADREEPGADDLGRAQGQGHCLVRFLFAVLPGRKKNRAFDCAALQQQRRRAGRCGVVTAGAGGTVGEAVGHPHNAVCIAAAVDHELQRLAFGSNGIVDTEFNRRGFSGGIDQDCAHAGRDESTDELGNTHLSSLPPDDSNCDDASERLFKLRCVTGIRDLRWPALG